MSEMNQVAPYPAALERLVDQITYKDGWRFYLENADRGQGCQGLTLVIIIHTRDTYHPDRFLNVSHGMPVPPAAYDERSWRRWLFEQILLVERHEACEFFQIAGERTYAPSHGPGNDPYLIREIGTVQDVHTSFTGEVSTPSAVGGA